MDVNPSKAGEIMSRLEQLAEIFEKAAKCPTNVIDPPFDCVPLNLRPQTCAEIAALFRSWQVLVTASNQ
jgi:hypothetical protein